MKTFILTSQAFAIIPNGNFCCCEKSVLTICDLYNRINGLLQEVYYEFHTQADISMNKNLLYHSLNSTLIIILHQPKPCHMLTYM